MERRISHHRIVERAREGSRTLGRASGAPRLLRRVGVAAAVGAIVSAMVTAGTVSARSTLVESAGAPTVVTTVSVPAANQFTDTGIALTAGEVFSIGASGTVHYSVSGTTGPGGVGFSGNTTRTNGCASSQLVQGGFTAPGLTCWSLVGKIGASGVIFFVGRSFAMKSPVAGELILGFNDNFYPDNSGAFAANVTTP